MALTPLPPSITDNLWAVCELIATAFQIAQVFKLRQDKRLAGVHWYMTAFYIGWGLINIPAYASLGQFHAMWCGAAMTVANVVWLSYAIRYRHAAAAVAEIPVKTMQAARLLRAAAEDALMAIKGFSGGAAPGMGLLMMAGQVRVNLENAIATAQIRGITRARNLDGDADTFAS